MQEKRFKRGSPELDLDLRDKTENMYEEIQEEPEPEQEYEPLYHKKETMRINKSKIIGLIIIIVVLVGLYLIPNIDTNTKKEIEAINIDTNTKKEIQEIKNRAVEFKKQKELRRQIKDLNRELDTSINNVVKIENKIRQYRQSNLKLIK